MIPQLTDKHRRFYVNGKLEFALFFDSTIQDKDQILSEFLASREWKTWADYVGVKFKRATFSDDLLRLDIEA